MVQHRAVRKNYGIKNSYPLLKQSGLLRSFAGYWVRSEVSISYEWSTEEEKILTPLVDRFKQKIQIIISPSSS